MIKISVIFAKESLRALTIALLCFSAQVMLTAAPLAELLKMSRDELKETCPWIPQRILAVCGLVCQFKPLDPCGDKSLK